MLDEKVTTIICIMTMIPPSLMLWDIARLVWQDIKHHYLGRRTNG